MSFDPQTVLANVDRHAVGVTAFMTLCLVSTFVYLVSAFRTSRRDRSFPGPLSAVGSGAHIHVGDRIRVVLPGLPIRAQGAGAQAHATSIRHGGDRLSHRDRRGQTMLMNWCLLGDIIGMSGAWFFLEPWFRSPPFIAFTMVTIGWNIFNLWVMNKHPKYDSAADLRISGQAGVVAI